MIKLTLDRHGRSVRANLAVSGTFSLTATLVFIVSMTSDGRELLSALVKLLLSLLR